MLGSPVEVRYDDGIVLIQTDGGGPVRASDGGGQPCASDGGGEADAQHASQTSSQESIAASPESRSIIIRDGHREGCGSITIVTTPNNLKISINTKRYDRQSAFQAAKRTLTKDLRNKLGELDMLLKASCDDDDGNERGSPSAGNRSSPAAVPTVTNVTTGHGMEETTSTTSVTATGDEPNVTTRNGMEENTGTTCTAEPGAVPNVTTGNVVENTVTTSVTETTGACSLDTLQQPLRLLNDVPGRTTNENEISYLGTVVDLETNRDCLVRFGDAAERQLSHSTNGDAGIEGGKPSGGNRSSPVTVQTQPNSMTSNGTEENTDTTSMMESAGACSLDSLQEPIYLLDDVLVRPTNENEIFYLGTVVDLEPNHDCLVRFGDATERRFSRSSITRCSGTDRQSRSMTQTPTQNDDELQLTRTESKPPLLRFPPELFPLVSSMQLPYDLKNLKWDSNHRVNTTGNYCYCGNDGDWAREMLQCRRCEQWFHGRCVRSLQFPIFHGDTFYVFICSICNHGHEFVRRLVVSASNLAHLVLYNLIMRNGRRFYGLRTAILPYIEDNQRTLQLSDKFLKLSTNERADLLLNTFKSNKNRFYNGKDFNLSSQLWSLHQPVPPPVEPITIPIPPKETITETMLQQKLETTEHFRFLPRVYHERNYFMDGATRERMVGLLYANHPESVEDPRTEFCFIGRLFPPAPEAPKQSNTIDPPSGVASTAQPSTSTQASVVASNNGSNGQVGARRRKRYGIRPTPTTLLTTISGLDRIIPRPSNFDGPNNPFYEDDSSTGSVSTGRMRYAYRKLGNMKRRACDESQPYMSSTKRRKMGPAGSSSLSSAAVSRIRPMRKRALSDVAEESHEELSWHNVQCGSMYMQRRSCATGSSSSGMAEQGEATVATGQICSDGSGEIRKIKQFASGRRSSGRLIALRTKDYSDTRRNKRSREPDTVVQPDGSSTVSRGRLNSGSVTTDDSDQSNGDRVSLRTFSTSGNESSSCAVRKIYWEQEKLATTPADQQQEENLIKCVVVAKRILPDGKQEHLLEEIN